MAVWKELMFHGIVTEVTIDADTAFAAPGTWTPTKSGILKEVQVIPGGVAATSLIETGYIKMSFPDGQPDLYSPFDGGGLRTAPRGFVASDNNITKCNAACKAGVPIKGFYYHNVLPVTPELFVYGTFEG